jgi:hypothetical protein
MIDANTKIYIASTTSIDNTFKELITNSIVKTTSLLDMINLLKELDISRCRKADVSRHIEWES